MNTERKFYVYIHRRKTDGRIFYVGKGSKRRAWYFHDRFQWWQRIHKKHGTTVEICQNRMNEEDAYLLEMWLIAKLRHEGVELANFTDGGDAPPKWHGKDHPNYNPEIVHLVHPKTGGKFVGTRQQFLEKYKTTQGNFICFLSGKYKSHKGWIKHGEDPSVLDRTGKNHPAYDASIYNLENKDGRKFSGTRYEFASRFAINALQINAFLRGRQHTLHGWFPGHMKGKLPPGNIGRHNNNFDPTVFKFRHKDGRVFVGTGLDLHEQHGATGSGIHCIKIGRYRFHAGWEIVERIAA